MATENRLRAGLSPVMPTCPAVPGAPLPGQDGLLHAQVTLISRPSLRSHPLLQDVSGLTSYKTDTFSVMAEPVVSQRKPGMPTGLSGHLGDVPTVTRTIDDNLSQAWGNELGTPFSSPASSECLRIST